MSALSMATRDLLHNSECGRTISQTLVSRHTGTSRQTCDCQYLPSARLEGQHAVENEFPRENFRDSRKTQINRAGSRQGPDLRKLTTAS